MTHNLYDVAIIGGGPAGLQCALILARTRQQIIVFDSPEPPRNAASHGVHNFVGLDGLTYREIRKQAWEQINVYNSVEYQTKQIVDVQPHDDGRFLVTDADGTSLIARHVILAIGFKDIYPAVSGFDACWGDTILMCPYCDGYENRDRVWGLVIGSEIELEHMPMIYRNWTQTVKFLIAPDVPLSPEKEAQLNEQGTPVHRGAIHTIHHTAGKIEAVTLDTGETVAVQTLWWKLDDEPQPLTSHLITTFDLALDERGYIKTDANHETSTKGLWAVGDVKGWATALGAAFVGSQAAYAITRLPR